MNPYQVIGLSLIAIGGFIFGTGLAKSKETAQTTPVVPDEPPATPVAPQEPTTKE